MMDARVADAPVRVRRTLAFARALKCAGVAILGAIALALAPAALAQTGSANVAITLGTNSISGSCSGCVTITSPPVAEGTYDFSATGGVTPDPNFLSPPTTVTDESLNLSGLSADIFTGSADISMAAVSCIRMTDRHAALVA
jgi:hypothetical protein